MDLPRVLSALLISASSMWYAGTGSGCISGQVAGSRGLSRESRWSNGAAAASLALNASPRFHTFRSVAIIDVCRCSSLITIPSSTHGETMIAGTR
jgi:hypothetical protein